MGNLEVLFRSLGAGLGVLVGIVVGVLISIFVRRWEQRNARDAQFKSLIAEMRFNVGKIEAWLDELVRCRSAIVEDRLHDWYGFSTFTLRSFGLRTTCLGPARSMRGLALNSSRTCRWQHQICR